MRTNSVLRLIQGALIGAGAILPGISGGVLAVIFGVYQPIMETLAHPREGLKKHARMLLPLVLGWAAGFMGGGAAILALLDHSETVATCLFIGLILGTMPSLWKEAGAEGRGRGACLSLILCFAALLAALLYARFGTFGKIPQNFSGFLFCGILWGMSIIVPGMTSSSILMAVGLLTPLLDGITSLDFSVLLPWLIGMGAVLLLLSHVVEYLFRRHGRLFRHAVVGIVLASTVVIVPLHYAGTREFIMSIVCSVLGFAAAVFGSRFQAREEEKEG